MGIICESCGRDIDALGQDNMGTDAPLCEDCWNEKQGHMVGVLRREVRDLRFENSRLREKLDAMAEEAVDPTWVGRMRNTAVQNLRKDIETAYEVSRERALALTKLDECEMWLGRCESKETAAPTLEGAAQDAAMPCLKGDVKATVKPEQLAEVAARSLRESVQPALRMAVE